MTTPPPNGAGRSPGLPSLDRLPGLRGLTVTSEPAPIFADTVRRSMPRTAASARTAPRPADLSDIDWALVYRIRYTVAERLANAAGPLVDEATRLQIGRDMIPDIVKEHSDNAVLAGDRENQITNRDFERYRRAVDSAIFGYGRWQSLMDDPEVENIEIRGHDQVFMVYADRIIPVAPVADSNAELLEQLQFIATYSKTPKPFSEAHPEMTLNLEDRFRLHAEAYSIVDRPTIVIRQHTFAGVTLERLCELGMFPPQLVGFLAAAIRARQSIVISGNQGVGKTTFLRALAMAMDPLEAVGVIETDAELFLHKLPGRGRTVNYVARGASGEGVGADGQPLGQFSVQRHLTASLRQNLSRIIVGEVRDAEAAAMFQAMQSGAGSLSTIHAQHAEATIERLVTAAALGGVMTQVDAYRQIAVNINLIVHLGAVDERSQGGKYRRFVNEITEVDGFADTADGTSFMPATNPIYHVTDPTRPLDLTMSAHMKSALAAQGWKP